MLSKLKLIAISLISLCLGTEISAQSYEDLALLFGRSQVGGTARIMGIGGTQVSLGGDPSLSLSNPAGLGMSNSSSFTLSPGIIVARNDSKYYDTSISANRTLLALPQLGLIFHIPSENSSSKYRGGSFAINFTRSDSYQNTINYAGFHEEHSLVDNLIATSDGINPDRFDMSNGDLYNTLQGLGWNNYLTEGFLENDNWVYGTYVSAFPREQRQLIERRGAQNITSFSYGGNYDDRIFFGGGLNFLRVNYSNRSTLEEYQPVNSADLEWLVLNENLSVSGSGVNATIGLIIRPIDILQVGASYQTRSLYNLNDTYDAELSTQWNDYEYPETGEILTNENAVSDIILSDYRLRTPAKLSLGATAFLGKYGFVSADIERLDYGNTSMSSSDFIMDSENDFLTNTYGSVTNIRLGAEFRLGIFRLRAGGGVYGDPRNGMEGLNISRRVLTGGAGIMKKEWSFDFALINSAREIDYYPYALDGIEPVNISQNQFTTQFTIGYKF